jgi:hypothetical protein
MHTPAVLTFLHLLAACLLQLVLVAWGVLPPPQVSAAAAKGALLPAAITALQVCMVAGGPEGGRGAVGVTWGVTGCCRQGLHSTLCAAQMGAPRKPPAACTGKEQDGVLVLKWSNPSLGWRGHAQQLLTFILSTCAS